METRSGSCSTPQFDLYEKKVSRDASYEKKVSRDASRQPAKLIMCEFSASQLTLVSVTGLLALSSSALSLPWEHRAGFEECH